MAKDKSELEGHGKPMFYACLLPRFVKCANELGYALAVHGSLKRDLDLIAVAWTNEAESHEVLVKQIGELVGETVWKEYYSTTMEQMPHGRLCYTLSIAGDWFIDLSVIPPKEENR